MKRVFDHDEFDSDDDDGAGADGAGADGPSIATKGFIEVTPGTGPVMTWRDRVKEAGKTLPAATLPFLMGIPIGDDSAWVEQAKMSAPGVSMGPDMTSATISVGKPPATPRNPWCIRSIVHSLTNMLKTKRSQLGPPKTAMTKADRLTRSRDLSIPLRTFKEDQDCMCEPRTVSIGDRSFTAPSCVVGRSCVTARGDIEGINKPLMIFMSGVEMDTFLSTGKIPTNGRKRMCVMCQRELQFLFVTALTRAWDETGSAKAEDGVVTVAQMFSSKIGPGEYQRNFCWTNDQAPCLGYPIVIPRTLGLVVRRVPSEFKNAVVGSTSLVVDQSVLRDDTGRQPRVSFPERATAPKRRRQRGGDDDDDGVSTPPVLPLPVVTRPGPSGASVDIGRGKTIGDGTKELWSGITGLPDDIAAQPIVVTQETKDYKSAGKPHKPQTVFNAVLAERGDAQVIAAAAGAMEGIKVRATESRPSDSGAPVAPSVIGVGGRRRRAAILAPVAPGAATATNIKTSKADF